MENLAEIKKENKRNTRNNLLWNAYWDDKNFTATIKKFQDINGNTYHAVRVSLIHGSQRLILSFKRYGYGTHYEETTLEELDKIGFCGIEKKNIHFSDFGYGLKRDMISWSKGGYFNKD